MQYIFDEDVAKEYGVNEAIMIANLQFWIRKNKANQKHEYDGRTWTYNSKAALARLFLFWSEKQVRTILDKLRKNNVIITGNYNQNSYDRTLWYAFADEDKWLGHNETICRSDLAFSSDQMDRPIPDNYTDNYPDIKENKEIIKERKESYDKFEEFWQSYVPVKCDGKVVAKGSKKDAERKFITIAEKNPSAADDIIQGAKRYLDYCRNNNILSCGVPVFLNQERWKDDYPVSNGPSVEDINLFLDKLTERTKAFIAKFPAQNALGILEFTDKEKHKLKILLTTAYNMAQSRETTLADFMIDVIANEFTYSSAIRGMNKFKGKDVRLTKENLLSKWYVDGLIESTFRD